MDSHGKQFIEALEALTQKMKAAENLYDIDDAIHEGKEVKEQLEQERQECRTESA